MSTARNGFFASWSVEGMTGYISGCFNWLYEHSPVNFANFTGWHHPSAARLKGGWLLGSADKVAKPDGSGVMELITELGKLAEKDAHGRAYCNFVNRPSMLLTSPQDITQILIYNCDKLDRSRPLKAFAEQFGYNNILMRRSDEIWKAKRAALMSWVYADSSLNQLSTEMQRIIDNYIDHLKENGEVPSAEKFFVELAMDIVSQTVLGSQSLGEHAGELSAVLAKALDAACNPINAFASKDAKSKIGQIIAHFNRKTNADLGLNRKDLHQAFMQHFMNFNQNQPKFHSNKNLYQKQVEEFKYDGEQAKEILDDVVLLFLAGHETSARLMQFTLFALQKHPRLLKDVIKEIEDNQPKNGDWTAKDLSELKLLGKVLKESLRLYPPFPVVARMVTEEIILADIPLCKNRQEYDEAYKKRDVKKDIVLHPGQTIQISPWITHHMEKHFSHANEFNPARHKTGLEEFSAHTSDRSDLSDEYFALLPFLYGDRDCPGRKFALRETMLVLIKLLTHFDFKAEMSQDASAQNFKLLDTIARGSLRQKGEVNLSFTPRH